MVSYNQSIIYKLCCNDTSITDIYIGGTTNYYRRKQAHKQCCNENVKGHNLYIYQFIRTNGGWDNWGMIEIEKFNATDKRDLNKRKRHWLETLKATLNKIIPTRTLEEYRQDNREKIKEYIENNKEKLKEQKKQYYEKNKEQIKEKGKEYRENNEEQIKKYYDDNKEKIKEKGKEYRQDNKEKIKEKYKEYYKNNKEKRNKKFECECGGKYLHTNKSSHFKTKKHQEYMKSK